MDHPRGEHGAGVAGGDDRVGRSLGDRADGRDEARVGLRPHGVGGLVGHLDRLGRDDERQPLRVEALWPEERHLDPIGGGVERAEDHLVGRVVSSKRVDCDAGHPRFSR